MKPGSLLQIDWHLTQEATEIFQSLFHPNSLKLRQFGLLEKPSASLQLDEVSYKLFVTGKGGIGKTSFIAHVCGGQVPTSYCETPGIQVTIMYWPVKLLHTSRVVMFRLEFWDAGEGALKKFDHILSACKEDMDAVLFLFSFTERSTFDEIPQQMSRILQPSDRPSPIVIGTRYDQHAASEVVQRDIRDFEQRWKIPVVKMKTAPCEDQLSKTLQKGDFNEVALSLNIICNQLWQRDQTLAGISVSAN